MQHVYRIKSWLFLNSFVDKRKTVYVRQPSDQPTHSSEALDSSRVNIDVALVSMSAVAIIPTKTSGWRVWTVDGGTLQTSQQHRHLSNVWYMSKAPQHLLHYSISWLCSWVPAGRLILQVMTKRGDWDLRKRCHRQRAPLEVGTEVKWWMLILESRERTLFSYCTLNWAHSERHAEEEEEEVWAHSSLRLYSFIPLKEKKTDGDLVEQSQKTFALWLIQNAFTWLLAANAEDLHSRKNFKTETAHLLNSNFKSVESL